MSEGQRPPWVVDTPEGFEVPVHHAALKPRLMLGAHADVTTVLAGGAVLAFIWQVWPVLPLALILQAMAVWCTRWDDKWFQKVSRVVRYKMYYKA